MIGAHDMIVAATAISLGWDVLTFNAAEFGQIEGLGVRAPY
jgi:predicted nucleic acid-binding protein